MTVSSETNKISYNGNGVTSVFAYTFKILDDDEILVQKRVTSTGVLTTLIKTTDYTVSGVGDANGGNITLVDAATDAPSGSTIVISRNMALTQLTDYNEYDAFPAATHEEALDRLTMITQQQQEEIDRSVKFDIGVTTVDLTLPDPTDNALKGLVLNATEDGFEWSADVTGYTFPSSAGVLVQTDTTGTVAVARTLTGTANEITVTDGTGVSGNPTFSLPTALTFTGKTVTGGTFSSPTISSPTVTGTVTTTATYSAPVLLSSTTFADVTDATKKIQFVMSGITTATTRNITWQDVAGTVYVSGGTDVSVADGGTGASSFTANYVLLGNGTSAFQTVAPGTSGNLLTSNGTTWVSSAPTSTGKPIVQQVYTITGTMATGTTAIPADNTTPQNTEGDQYMSLSITPTNASNLLIIDVIVHMSNSNTNVNYFAALFQDSTANALKTGYVTGSTAGAYSRQIRIKHIMAAGTTSSTTFKVRAGAQTGATTTFNGYSGLGLVNGTACSLIHIQEITV